MCQKDKTIINVFVSNKSLKPHKAKPDKTEGEIHNSTKIVGDFNALLLVSDRSR